VEAEQASLAQAEEEAERQKRIAEIQRRNIALAAKRQAQEEAERQAAAEMEQREAEERKAKADSRHREFHAETCDHGRRSQTTSSL